MRVHEPRRQSDVGRGDCLLIMAGIQDLAIRVVLLASKLVVTNENTIEDMPETPRHTMTREHAAQRRRDADRWARRQSCHDQAEFMLTPGPGPGNTIIKTKKPQKPV